MKRSKCDRQQADFLTNLLGTSGELWDNQDKFLSKVSKELEAKSQEDEQKVRELNVNVENLNMNVSLQHRTVLGLVEDRKFSVSII